MSKSCNQGEDHPSAKLTAEDVRLMRQLYAEDISVADIAEKFEVSWATAYDAISYRTWSHV